MPRDWLAPTSAGPVHATVVVPGSKSQTARELVLSALAAGPTQLVNPLVSRDSELMVTALRRLGCDVDQSSSTWHVQPRPLRGGTTVDCGLAGTVMRFLAPVAALADGPVTFVGDDQARARPIDGLLDALTRLGVRVDRTRDASLPFTVHGSPGAVGGEVTVATEASSQFLSALLLSGGRFGGGLHVRPTGRVPSRPHVDMTVAALRGRGVAVVEPAEGTESSAGWRVGPGAPEGGEISIEPDLSNAAPFLAAAAVTAGQVTVRDWPQASLQPGEYFVEIMRAMGAVVDRARGGLTMSGPARLHSPGVLDLSQAGELVPTIAAVCLFAEGSTRITGVAHLRGHETDRLAALTQELTRVGAEVEQEPDGITIHPRALRGATMRTYHDHRMATTAAIIGLRVPGTLVENVGTTAKTLPQFPDMWRRMLEPTPDGEQTGPGRSGSTVPT
jgi:3-phosphoshikimate 1-carboxyvinyltransferase